MTAMLPHCPEIGAFLSSIHANPSDDTHRLVFADWLDEHDDPRGEYIRLSCATDVMDNMEDPAWSALFRRKTEWERQWQDQWLGDRERWPGGLHDDRGLWEVSFWGGRTDRSRVERPVPEEVRPWISEA